MDSLCLLAVRVGAGQHSAGCWPRPRQEGGPAVQIRDILHNNVKEKLERDEVVASMTVRLVRTMENARIARTARFESLYVDIQPSGLSPDTRRPVLLAPPGARAPPVLAS